MIEKLKAYGLLLLTDARLPSVASIVVGAPVKGSWWAHPAGHAIFRAAEELAEHPDILICKLVSGKVTFVHRRLWPAVAAVGSAREPWQLAGLSRAARALLDRVTRQGEIQVSGDATRELERVLLVSSEQVHTASGAHAKVLRTWDSWAVRRITPQRAKQQLEQSLAALNRQFNGKGRLPWLS